MNKPNYQAGDWVWVRIPPYLTEVRTKIESVYEQITGYEHYSYTGSVPLYSRKYKVMGWGQYLTDRHILRYDIINQMKVKRNRNRGKKEAQEKTKT